MRRVASSVSLLLVASSSAADPPALPAVVTVTASATSTLASKTNRYEPTGPLRSDKRSAPWCEGKPDDGIGEALVIDLSAPIAITSLQIAANIWARNLFEANNRITELAVSTDDGRSVIAAVPGKREMFDVPIGGKPIKQLKLTIGKVTRGRMNDSCITSVELEPADPVSLLVGFDPAAVAALAPGFAAIFNAVQDCDADAFKQHVTFPMKFVSVGNKQDTMRTRTTSDAAALTALCKKGELSQTVSFASTPKLRPTTEPNALDLIDDTITWHLQFRRGEWKLVGLEDDTP